MRGHGGYRGRAAVRVENPCDLGRGRERHVGGDRDQPVATFARERLCRERHRGVVPPARRFDQDAGAERQRQRARPGVAGDDGDAGERIARGERREHVPEHGEKQLPPLVGREHGGEPLLRLATVLGRHHRPHRRHPRLTPS